MVDVVFLWAPDGCYSCLLDSRWPMVVLGRLWTLAMFLGRLPMAGVPSWWVLAGCRYFPVGSWWLLIFLGGLWMVAVISWWAP